MPTKRATPNPLLFLAIIVILAATLFPSGVEQPGTGTGCLICGARGLADALLNVMLFVPLGTALALCRWSVSRSYIFAAGLSLGIELAQLFLPGRNPTPGDVLFNTLGAAFGIFAVRSATYWLLPRGMHATRLAVAAAIAGVSVCAGIAQLLEPSFPGSTYYGQWTANLGHLEWYRGRVLEAKLGGLQIPGRRLVDSDAIRELLLEGAPLYVRAVAGPPTPALGPLLSIYDDQQREIILLGPDRGDLVFRFRTHAAALRLDQPDLRALGAIRDLPPGDTIEITVWRDPSGSYMAMSGNPTRRLGFTIGSGWGILLYPETLPAWLKMLLNGAWVAALFIPLGFWTRTRWGLLVGGGALIAGLVWVPAVTSLIPTPPGEFAGAGMGFSLGVVLHKLLRWRGLELPGQS